MFILCFFEALQIMVLSRNVDESTIIRGFDFFSTSQTTAPWELLTIANKKER
jgi:hypothetical protein